MKISFKSIVIMRAKGGKASAKIEVPRSVWQEHGLRVGDVIRVAIIGRVFESRISGTETQKLFTIPLELCRELRLRDSESVEVEVEKMEKVNEEKDVGEEGDED